MAAAGYPGDYPKGDVIFGLEQAGELEDVVVFHAGTGQRGEEFVTNGGRVLGVTALGGSVGSAIERAYEGVARITWNGVHYRTDIGRKALHC
jgi:phosphoribosylamine--glycine ligase